MSKEEINLTQNVEKGDGINVNRGSGNCRDWNGIHYKTGMSSKNVGSKELSMNVATIPPGRIACTYSWRLWNNACIPEGNVRHEYGPVCKKKSLKIILVILFLLNQVTLTKYLIWVFF